MSLNQTVTLRTGAWYGDLDLSLQFPERWNLTICRQANVASISDQEILLSFHRPLGTKRICDAAKGKRNVAIIIDDLSRPTPTERLLPFVLDELREAAIPKDQISIVVGVGSHRPLTEGEILKKVGPQIARDYLITSHDFMADDLINFGKVSGGMPVYINRTVAQAEFKICVGGIYPHKKVGFGGGSKLLIPGVSGFATIHHFHKFCVPRGHGLVDRPATLQDGREVLEEAAHLVGLDMIVNCVINRDREITGVFVGDPIKAHRAGAKFAKIAYSTSIPSTLRHDTQLLICNAYPMDTDPTQGKRAIWPYKYFDNDPYLILINAATDGIFFHGLLQGMSWGEYTTRPITTSEYRTPDVKGPEKMLVFSEHFQLTGFKERHPDGLLFREWKCLIYQLSAKLPDKANVTIFPEATIQVLDNVEPS